MRRRRKLADLHGFALYTAVREALACLAALAARGAVVRHRGTPARWSRPGG